MAIKTIAMLMQRVRSPLRRRTYLSKRAVRPSHKRGWHRETVRVPLVAMLLFFVTSWTFLVLNVTFKSASSQDSGTNALRRLLESSRYLRETQDSIPASALDKTVYPTIAYAVSVTGCGEMPVTEGAAVLKHSIHRASRHGHLGGKYDYHMYAIYHPVAEACAISLSKLGYRLLRRDVLVNVSDIRGDILRSRIQREETGVSAEKELIKLEAYTLTDYPIVVHLDLDSLVLKPMDDVFDMMLGKKPSDARMWKDKEIPEQVNAMYTYDYNYVLPAVKYKPVQGGLIIVRPNLTVYEEFRQIYLEGDYRDGKGWGGLVGPFWGAMTIQGVIPYYYDVLRPNQTVELNRCIYNQMCDNPRDLPTVNNVVNGKCKTRERDCEDCRERPLMDVVSAHFTICGKPWECLRHFEDILQTRLCRKLTHEWYRIRYEMESSWGRPQGGPGEYDVDQFYGYCRSNGEDGYLLIEEPYGEPLVPKLSNASSTVASE